MPDQDVDLVFEVLGSWIELLNFGLETQRFHQTVHQFLVFEEVVGDQKVPVHEPLVLQD